MFKNIYVIGLWDELCAQISHDKSVCYLCVKLCTRTLPKNSLSQSIKYIELVARVIVFLINKNIAIVAVHSLSLLPLGCLLKLIFGVSVIYDAHELETERNKLHGLRKAASRLLENRLISFVDEIFVVSESIRAWYEAAYPNIRPIVVYNSPRKTDKSCSNLFRETFDVLPSTKIILYQGLLSSGRGIEKLLKFSCQSNLDFVVVFMGYGPLCELIKQCSTNCSKVLFHCAVPPSDLLRYTQSADYGICMIEDTCLSYRFCMPNKLFEYAAAGLPILVSNLPEIASFVSTNRCGVIADMATLLSFENSIKDLFALDYSEASRSAIKASSPYLWDRQEQKIIDVYQYLLISKH